MEKNSALVGTRAPDFSLLCTGNAEAQRRHVSLAHYQDRWLILYFYPRDFSFVCPTELIAVSERLAEFQKRECDILAISTDGPESHERWLVTPRGQGGLGGLKYPLASDESGAACKAYGVYVPRQHLALRGLFIIDPNGVLQYQAVHNLSVGRSTEEILRVLDALQTGGMCPAEWSPGQPLIDPSVTLGPESTLGPYRIEAIFGNGSFGSVFRAWDTVLQRRVALKILRAEGPTQSAAVLAEARAAAALNHPNICIVHAVDAGDLAPMIVMEFIEGEPLSQLLQAGPLSLDAVVSLGRQIADAMASAHEKGIIHGDRKPANIMITPATTAKIMDFGLAQRQTWADVPQDSTSRNRDQAGGISGTPAYMAPEQARGEPSTAASDVFSLGLVLFEMVTGRRVVSDSNLLEAMRRLERLDPMEFALQTPEPIAAILGEALRNDPGERRLTMAQIAEILSGTAADV
jgi:eukaryotic-like serine/threonine-protein kinase